MAIVDKSNSLQSVNPDLANEWHPTKNGKLTPKDLTFGSNKKVWWKCDKGEDHEWEASIVNRTKGRGCPICRGYKVVKSNCLATTHPDLAKDWHPTKNGNLTPYDVVPGSGKKVWWKCPKGDDHEWEGNIYDRAIGGYGCPICSGRKVVKSNCLATTHPNLAKEWHPTKNGKLTPYDVVPGMRKKVWWKCPKGDDHEWAASGDNRLRVGSSCPICNGKKVVKSTCLATTHPDLTKEWHPTKNGKLTPYDVIAGSGKKVWWKCPKGNDHEWEAQISSRSNGKGCPICQGLKVVTSNCLATTHPDLAKEWHPTKNGKLTPYDVVAGMRKKVWWKCAKGNDHEWEASGDNRVRMGSCCPFCTLLPQSKQELTILFELKSIFSEINPKGFKTRIGEKTVSIDIFIPRLTLGVEFDGSFWHKDNLDFDKLKSKKIREQGFHLIRIREEPLERLHETDIISCNPFNPKKVTDEVLNFILSSFSLSEAQANKVNAYLQCKGVQNEIGLNRYIDQILVEKGHKE